MHCEGTVQVWMKPLLAALVSVLTERNSLTYCALYAIWVPLQLTPDCLDLLDELLQKQPWKRVTAANVLEHPWMTRQALSRSVPHSSLCSACPCEFRRCFLGWLVQSQDRGSRTQGLGKCESTVRHPRR